MSAKKNISIFIVIFLIGGAVYLDVKEIPARQHLIEKVIGNERFLK
jgi:hypothetical protein